MMRIDVVPNLVFQFRGLQSSAVETLAESMWIVLFEVAKKAVVLMVELAGIAFAWQGIKLVLSGSAQALSITMIASATFWSSEALAVTYAGKTSELITPRLGYAPQKEEEVQCACPASPIAPRLPRLNTRPLPVSTHTSCPASSAYEEKVGLKHRSAPCMAPARRRVLNQLRQAPPVVNHVQDERRRRADQDLFQSKIRVGKAWLDPVAARGLRGKRRRVDMYMVRVDCGQPDDKHMNPVVMWDITTTYNEFLKLEKDLRAEVKAKKLRNIRVPHLSSGAILFVQEELNDDVLHARRTRLQVFIDAIAADPVLADLTATRKFFQVY